MKRFICLHAHFYQPPRENPWLEEIEMQDSAYPFHDWNSRIAAECYAPNTASRILDSERRIIDIVNNYSRISFNFGPTLLSWLERRQPDVYDAILDADRMSQDRFSGHGSAIAQIYNHMIMPLANRRDKETQILWGIRDFEYRFQRRPKGIWLSETAVDIETLDICAEQGVEFTILAPHQAHRFRPVDGGKWIETQKESIDPRQAYLCRLPSGRSISLFFYVGPIAQEIAFGRALEDGKGFADWLMNTFDDKPGQAQIVHAATDGETYGHHHRFGDMALAYCLYHIESNRLAQITNYGEFLENFPPTHEVEIQENTSWSCVHGVERWRDDCGCQIGENTGWQQEWRAPLRGAMDWLRDSLVHLFEEQAAELLQEPWEARNRYIDLILDRSEGNVDRFLETHAGKDLSPEEITTVLKLLELQRHAMLMYTSCGWFFDDISGIEAVQVMRYAARAIQLAREVTGIDLEPAYLKILERAPSNLPHTRHGAQTYDTQVRPHVLDLIRVGAHFAVSSLFEKEIRKTMDLYSYRAESEMFDRLEQGRQKLAVGKVVLRSTITRETCPMRYAVVHLGEQNLIGGVASDDPEHDFNKVSRMIKDSFQRSNIAEIVALIDEHLVTHHYTLWHMFKDEQRRVLNQMIEITLQDVEGQFRRVYDRYYSIMQATNELNIPLPRVLSTMVSLVLNTDIRDTLENEELDLHRLNWLVQETKRWNVEIDKPSIGYEANRRCNELMEEFAESAESLDRLETIDRLLEILTDLPLTLDLWRAQNVYFSMGKSILPKMIREAEEGDESARRWVELFGNLGEYLHVRIR
jgi:alpha-amylase/alpha-mannosidase (GH57 family)